MAAVLVYGKRVKVPRGWFIVLMGPVEKGDRFLSSGMNWIDVRDRDIGSEADDAIAIIRRDSSATEKP
jgi:hypothetical protein